MRNEMRWVPVTERMPNEDQDGGMFYITIANNGRPVVLEACWLMPDVERGFFGTEEYEAGEFNGYKEVEDVIAWMPVTYPDPYIPKEGKTMICSKNLGLKGTARINIASMMLMLRMVDSDSYIPLIALMFGCSHSLWQTSTILLKTINRKEV